MKLPFALAALLAPTLVLAQAQEYSWDFSDPNFVLDGTLSPQGGIEISNGPGDVRALRIDSASKKISLPANINPSAMLHCTVVIGVYLESIAANSLGWVLTVDNGGYDRSIILHDNRFNGMGMAVGVNNNVWGSDSGQPPVGEWMHVVAVFNGPGSDGYFYLDGDQAPNPARERNNGGNNVVTIGHNPLNPGRHWVDGWVKEVKIFDRALSPSEISTLYNQFGTDLAPTPGAQSDPIIIGFNQQVFKFEGRHEAWYANVANKHLFWNMQFRKFDTCPQDENMFIAGMSLSTLGHGASDILIATTPEPIEECRVNPNAICLGEGTLHISFDGGKSFVSQPGDYHYGSLGRVVAHNTYAACSRKWHDYDISNNNVHNLREGGRRMNIVEKKPLELLSDKKATMIDPVECGAWIDERVGNNDLFDQKGHWSTLYIETDVVSFHIEYRRSDWVNPKCDFQSLDAWMTKVDGKMEKVEWNGILGETKEKKYDATTGQQILSDRSKLLRGADDADYEVDGPFGKTFAVMDKDAKRNGIVDAALSTINKMVS